MTKNYPEYFHLLEQDLFTVLTTYKMDEKSGITSFWTFCTFWTLKNDTGLENDFTDKLTETKIRSLEFVVRIFNIVWNVEK